MKEDFLHYLWRLRRFDLSDLRTTEGLPLEILQTGEHNHHAGPDFTNARIRIAETLWAGNVELHLNASDWYKHRHQEDRAYDNVILHVVLDADEPVKRAGGETIPCLELKQRIPPKISKTYGRLLHNEHWIPCQHQFFTVADLTKQLWLDRVMVERLEQKTEAMAQRLEQNKNDWEETFYQLLARNFGVKVNTGPFEQLARSLPLTILLREKGRLTAVEALLFGQAGLLRESAEEDYPRHLQQEYEHLRKKYGLTPLSKDRWKFMRMRPANFPSIRIAQFATLIYQAEHLFSKILAARNAREIENMFEVKLSNYWQTHYVFGKDSGKKKKTLGKGAIHLLIINTIAPFLFLYGRMKGEEAFKDRALQLLEELPAEKNNILRQWQQLGMNPGSAYQSQALLQLKKDYCDRRRCLECSIGHAVLNQEG